MAEDTREIVYYKGTDYRVEFRGEQVSKLVSMNGITTLTVETKNLLTPEEYKDKIAKQRSPHVNWTK